MAYESPFACTTSLQHLLNDAGLKLPDGQEITLKSLFDVGLYPGELHANMTACLTIENCMHGQSAVCFRSYCC